MSVKLYPDIPLSRQVLGSVGVTVGVVVGVGVFDGIGVGVIVGVTVGVGVFVGVGVGVIKIRPLKSHNGAGIGLGTTIGLKNSKGDFCRSKPGFIILTL